MYRALDGESSLKGENDRAFPKPLSCFILILSGHIIEATERIHRYIEDTSEVRFLMMKKTQDAAIKNFEIIGEASSNILFIRAIRD
ncbi:MAG: hypothetical protein QX191_03760 [Methylococcaceae bacterium]